MRYRGFEITSCPDRGIERHNSATNKDVICNGYYCQVYPAGDEQYVCQLDNFCLAESYEIPDCSDDSLVSGIVKYVDDMFTSLTEAKTKLLEKRQAGVPDRTIGWIGGNENEQVLYHVTLLQNVPSICEHGLIPKLGARSIEAKEQTPGVFLFPSAEDMEDALSGWLGEWYNEHHGEDCPLAILQIHLTPDIQLEQTIVDYELVCKTTIPPECITFFDEQGTRLIDYTHTESPSLSTPQQALPVFRSEISIEQEEIDYIKKLLEMTGKEIYDKYGLKRDETITNTLCFKDGSELNIKVVICDEDETPYIDLVLFNKYGYEIACDTGDYTIEGEVSFETEHAIYTGTIKATERTLSGSHPSLDRIINQAEASKEVRFCCRNTPTSTHELTCGGDHHDGP